MLIDADRPAMVDYASFGPGGSLTGVTGTAMARLMNSGMDLNTQRPWFDELSGNTYVTRYVGRRNNKPIYKSQLITNAPATLLKDEWIKLDTSVRDVDRAELGAWNAVVSRGLTMNLPEGLGKTMLQWQTRGDIGDATMSMDPIRRGENDRALKEIYQLPLPVIHKDFVFTMRDLMVSRQNGIGIDAEDAQMATRKVLELAEKLLIGTYSYPTVGGGTIYGFTTQPQRLTGSVTNPTTVGWTPDTLLTEMLNGRQLLVNNYQRGNIMVFMGTSWMKYLDADYSAAKGSNTLRQRIQAIDGIAGIQTLDYLTGYQVLMVVMDSRTVRIVRYAPLRVYRWEEQGGFEIKMKVMMGAVPQFRTDYNGKIGLLHLS